MILLDAYAARSCPVKTHNAFDLTMRLGPHDESLQETFAGATLFRAEVLAEIILGGGDQVVDFRGLASDPAAHVEATRAQVKAGTPIIVGPGVPVDVEGHRKGRPDILIRGADRPDGSPGYVPVHVKRHRMLERFNRGAEQPWLFSPLSAPLVRSAIELPERGFRSNQELDVLQLAHYWRLLDAAGWVAPGTPTAGIIGTEILPELGDQHAICWVDLTRKFIRTFSRTSEQGWKRRAALERYDHEHGFRVKVAMNAARRTGGPDDPPPMVTPIVVRECERCEWWSLCRPQLGDNDLSLRISKSPLDVREISVLRTLGISTINDLVGVDLDALLPAYLPHVRHRPGSEERLRLAARRAGLMLAGVHLDRLGEGPVEVPEAMLEVDLDIETSADDRVYLWGFLVDDRRTDAEPVYRAFARFEPLDDTSESELATEALGWLDGLLNARPEALIFHYSDYELIHIAKLAEKTGEPAMRAVAQRRSAFVDLFSLMRDNFFGANGLGLKVVAHIGAGFEWRDPDPGGLNSQRWFIESISAGSPEARDAAAHRILEYNEDDVLATHALRSWLRGLE